MPEATNADEFFEVGAMTSLQCVSPDQRYTNALAFATEHYLDISETLPLWHLFAPTPPF